MQFYVSLLALALAAAPSSAWELFPKPTHAGKHHAVQTSGGFATVTRPVKPVAAKPARLGQRNHVSTPVAPADDTTTTAAPTPPVKVVPAVCHPGDEVQSYMFDPRYSSLASEFCTTLVRRTITIVDQYLTVPVEATADALTTEWATETVYADAETQWVTATVYATETDYATVTDDETITDSLYATTTIDATLYATETVSTSTTTVFVFPEDQVAARRRMKRRACGAHPSPSAIWSNSTSPGHNHGDHGNHGGHGNGSHGNNGQDSRPSNGDGGQEHNDDFPTILTFQPVITDATEAAQSTSAPTTLASVTRPKAKCGKKPSLTLEPSTTSTEPSTTSTEPPSTTSDTIPTESLPINYLPQFNLFRLESACGCLLVEYPGEFVESITQETTVYAATVTSTETIYVDTVTATTTTETATVGQVTATISTVTQTLETTNYVATIPTGTVTETPTGTEYTTATETVTRSDCTRAQFSELVTNGDFELGTMDPWNIFTMWPEDAVTVTTETDANGNYVNSAAVFQVGTMPAMPDGLVDISQMISTCPEIPYRVSLWYRTDFFQPGCIMDVSISGNFIMGTLLEGSAPGEWMLLQGMFISTMPWNELRVHVRCWIDPSDNPLVLLVDDISVVPEGSFISGEPAPVQQIN